MSDSNCILGSSGASPRRMCFRHNGYAYHREHQPKCGTKQRWVCKETRHKRCPARIHTSTANNEVLYETGGHTHPPDGSHKTALVVKPPTVRFRHRDFVYHRDGLSRNGTRRYWYCSFKYKMKCPARLITSVATGEVVDEAISHSHPPMDVVDKKTHDCVQRENPKVVGQSSNRRTIRVARKSPSKKPRTTENVDTKNKSPTVSASGSPENNNAPSTVTVVQRLMSLPHAKRASASVLFSSLLDEMEREDR